MDRFRQLAVAVSGTATDAGTLRYAALVSRLSAAQSIRLVHVLPAEGEKPAAGADPVRLQIERQAAAHLLVQPSVKVSSEVVAGPLTDGLLSYIAAQQVDLVIVGHKRETSGRRAMARRLAMKAPCSVWMVPEGSPPSINRILVPIDFSDHSEDTLRVAISLARASGAHCVPLHVYFNEAVTTYEGYDEVLRGEEQAAYEKFVEPIDRAGLQIEPIFEEGANVAHVIGRVAERIDADLIVMGTRGRSRSASILLGSVTEAAIIESRLPLLAVKHFGARMGLLEALLDPRFRYRSGLRTD
jgi:nucleotide-binding universal stress UspA family protein